MQVAVIGLFLMFLMLGSFIVACSKNNEKDKEGEDGVVNKGITTRKVRAE